MEKQNVPEKPDNEPTEAETGCNNNEHIMLTLSNFKIFKIYIIFSLIYSWLKCIPKKRKTDSENDQNPFSSKMKPLMFILFKNNLILKILTFSIKLRSNEIDKNQQPLSCASKAYRFVYFF